MKISIDFSVYAATQAFGNITGHLDFEVIPRLGETVCFMFPSNENVAPVSIEGYNPQLKIENIIHRPGGGPGSVSLMLQDVEVSSVEDAKRLASFFDKGFELFCDEYNHDA